MQLAELQKGREMTSDMHFCGIDPGLSGGIALIDGAGRVITCGKMPDTERGLWRVLLEIADSHDVVAMLEQLGGMPRRPRTERCHKCGASRTTSAPLQSPTTMLKMGTNYGQLRMGLVAAGIRFDEVLPRRWQASFGLVFSSGRFTATQKKNKHKAKAEHLFPGVEITHAIADALLIAEYCRRTMAVEVHG